MRQLEENVATEMGLEIDYDEVDARIAEEQAAAQALAGGALGLEGQALPGSASGAPTTLTPATPEDQAIRDFETQAMQLALPADEYSSLMRMAGEMLDALE